MNSFLKKCAPFCFGLLITSLSFWGLHSFGAIRIPKDAPVELTVMLLIWSTLISLPLYTFNYLKKHRVIVLKILSLIGLFILVILISELVRTPNTPIVVPLIIVLCVGVLYLLAPVFFKKYKVSIFTSYGCIMLYFLYIVLFTDYYQYHHENVIITLFIPILIITFLWLFEQWKWFQKLKADKTKAELTLLRNQINPHFFFNTLNNLYALSIAKSEKAPEVILKLSEMMRYTIYEGNKEKVLLKDEVEYLKNYIDLNNIRQHRKAEITFQHELDDDYSIIPLLLIILLENAFKHGIETMTNNAFININLVAKKNQLRFSIENNFDVKSSDKNTGIGLANLRKRLAILYPKSHTLTIEKKKSVFLVELEMDL